ncbi:universal stress protein [Polaribacter uvawellassae]|uniref:universal stress protein n=1 Tax=Polaribacter uvawellassae TaxID=3133495 RepID=UPI003219A9BC
MKKVLLPTDFSENSWNAILYALKLYAEEECTFYLLNSVKLKASRASNLSNKLMRVVHEQGKEELLALKNLAEITSKNAKHTFEIILSSEDLEQSIDTAIVKDNIDLVVMGTKGATGAKEFFFGSNTVKIIEQVKLCPVLVVPDDYNFAAPQKIAFPTDFNRPYNLLELKPLIDLAEIKDSKIKIFHINQKEKLSDKQERNFETLKDFIKKYEHDFYWEPKEEKKEVEINNFIKDLGIDILAMVNYKHSFIESITKEPVIKKIGFQPIIPFYVIPEQ